MPVRLHIPNSISMNWHPLTDLAQLDVLVEQSYQHPVLIFKHSTRCSISSMALSRLERDWQEGNGTPAPYYLDLIAYRPVSNAIAERLGVEHQSPQVLLLRNGKCVYHASHSAIRFQEIMQH